MISSLSAWFQSCLLSFTIQLLGTIALLYFGSVIFYRGIQTLRSMLPRDLAARYGKGSWVVVTGASDGIGRGFCEEFAKDGFNIVLISRNLQKLNKVSDELKKQFSNLQTKVIAADFVKSAEPGFFENIMEQLKGLDISVLVNNVGTDYSSPFKDFPEEKLREILMLNVFPQAILTRKLINQLSNRSKRSAIINLSSGLGMKPFPFVAPYSATKVYNDFLSRAIAAENPNIDITCLRPGFVSTPLAAWRPKNFWTITPNQCARGLMNKLGFKRFTHGHWKHSVYVTLKLGIVPNWIFDAVSRRVGSMILEAHRIADAQHSHQHEKTKSE